MGERASRRANLRLLPNTPGEACGRAFTGSGDRRTWQDELQVRIPIAGTCLMHME